MFRKLIFIICIFVVPCLKLVASPDSSGANSQLCQILGCDVKIEVDTQKQQVRVFEKNSLIKELPCSTGMPNTPTPEGSFETYEKIASNAIELDGKKISYYFLSNFNGHIGFHSKVFGEHPMVEEGERRFQEGLPSSAGCVRLLISDAQWIYENIGLGAVIEVR